jgi:Zn-dependent M28 family amino/carboxypeptidase
VYPGADDNGSGTSAVVELARVFTLAAHEGWRPKRNIIFLNVSGEEKGLFGSTWFVNHPPLPLDSIVSDLNIDMIGRTDSLHDSLGIKNYVHVIGANKLSRELDDIVTEQNRKYTHLELDYRYNDENDPNHFYRRSDHYNFAKLGIPVAFFFDGKHIDYHKPTDTPEKINLRLLTTRAQLIFLIAWEIANRDKRIVVDKK